MALPVTLTGLTTRVSKPFISSGGNVYVIGQEGTNILAAYKATDPTSSFTNVGTDITTPVAINGLDVFQVSDVLHVCTYLYFNGDNRVYYHTFNMATDTWSISNEVVKGTYSRAFGTSLEGKGHITVRSDGDVIILYPGEAQASMGTDYERVYYARREGGTWTIDVAVDNGGADHWYPMGSVQGSSDRTHFFFLNDDLNDGYQRTLTSANALETFPSSFDTSIDTSQLASMQIGTSYVSGANTKVRFPYASSTAATINSAKLDSADAPTVTTDTDITGASGVFAGANAISFAAHETTLWAAFCNSTTRNLDTTSNADDAGWATPSEFYDDTNIIGTVFTNVYTRGGNVVLAMTFSASGNAMYHEKVLSAGGPTADANFTFATMTTTAAGTLPVVGSATPTFAAMTTTADGTLPVVGESSTTFDAMTTTAAGTLPVVAESSTTFDAMTLTAEGTVVFAERVADASFTFDTMTTTSAGVVLVAGAGDYTYATMTTTAAAGLLVQAESSFTFDTMTLTADASAAGVVADANFTLADMTTASDGDVFIVGASSHTYDAMTTTSDGDVFIVAEASHTYDAMTTTAAGVLPIVAESSFTFDTMTVVSEGTVTAATPITADAEFTFATMTITSAASLPVQSVSDFTFDDMLATGAGVVLVAGAGALVYSDMSVASSVSLPIVGGGSVTFDDMTVEATSAIPTNAPGLWLFTMGYLGKIEDRVHNFLLANTVGTNIFWSNQDLWMKFFAERGYTSGTVDDRTRQFLIGYLGLSDTGQTLHDLWGMIEGPYTP